MKRKSFLNIIKCCLTQLVSVVDLYIRVGLAGGVFMPRPVVLALEGPSAPEDLSSGPQRGLDLDVVLCQFKEHLIRIYGILFGEEVVPLALPAPTDDFIDFLEFLANEIRKEKDGLFHQCLNFGQSEIENLSKIIDNFSLSQDIFNIQVPQGSDTDNSHNTCRSSSGQGVGNRQLIRN